MIHLSQFQLQGACARFPIQTVYLFRHVAHGDIHVRVESHGPDGDPEIPCRVDSGCLHRVAATLLRINPDIDKQISKTLVKLNPAALDEVISEFFDAVCQV